MHGPPGPVLLDPLVLQHRPGAHLDQLADVDVRQGLDRLPGPGGQQPAGQQPAHRLLKRVPTLITYGRHDIVTSTRFAAPLTEGLANTELIVFEDCAHAAIYQDVDGFNQQTLAFLQRHSG